MEPEVLLLCSQQTTSNLNPKPHESSPCSTILRYILILSLHLHKVVPYRQDFQQKFLTFPNVLMCTRRPSRLNFII